MALPAHIQGMQFGAVLMIDALGFKDIWNPDTSKGRWTPEDVLAKMEMIRIVLQRAESGYLRRWPQFDTGLNTKFMCFSDTVVALFWTDNADTDPVRADGSIIPVPSERSDAARAYERARSIPCLRLAIGTALEAIRAGHNDEPKLNYRGAISIGSFIADKDSPTYLGPAIDECSKMFEVPQGAFIVLTDEARSVLENLADDSATVLNYNGWGNFAKGDIKAGPLVELVEYDVPCKDKQCQQYTKKCLSINPFAQWDGDPAITSMLAKSMLERMDAVPSKQLNSEKFFKHILSTPNQPIR